jgi:predicted O-methyltransferase YrrM
MTQMPDLELQSSWLERLYALNAVVASAGEPLEGNIFYPGGGDDFTHRPPDSFHRAKRDRFREAISGRERMLEVGVNGGHSAFLALSANPGLSYHGVDIGSHAYVSPAVAWLQEEFPGRVFFHKGSSLTVLPELVRQQLCFDVFHVDGHKPFYYEDITNCSPMASRHGAVIVIDDAQNRYVAKALRRCLRLHVVEPLQQFPSMDRSINRKTNEIARLIPSSWVKWITLRSYSRAIELSSRGRTLLVRCRRWAQRGWSRGLGDR